MHELAGRGVELTSWYCKPSVAPGPLRREYENGVPIIVPPTIEWVGPIGKVLTRLGYWFFETWFMLRQLVDKPDAILVRDKYWGAVMAWAVCRMANIKLLIWVSYPYPEHDTEESENFTGWRRLMKKMRAWLGYRMLYRFVMPRADHCFVQSEQMKEDMLVWGVPAQKMTPVPMGISRKVFESVDLTVPKADPPVVLYLGTLAAVRKLDILADAFKIVAARRPDARFKFVGDGDVPEERQALSRAIDQAGIASVTEFTGQLPMAVAWRHVAEAAVCVSPFRLTPVLRVASPTKFVEYLAFAKPTVGNRHPEHSMIARESDGALTVEWSGEAFADAIVWCLDHPDEAAAMAARGRRWIGEHRTYDRLGQLVYDQLVRVVGKP